MKDNHGIVKPSFCPHCGYFMDCATGARSIDVTPNPGDYSMCLNCAELLVFSGDLSLRKATDDDRESLSKDNLALIDRMKAAQRAVVKSGVLSKAERAKN